MPVINILAPHVADMIAAGEVVERPASVIKELVENSIDAGAGTITVEIRGGSATYIRVSDDGCGMAPEDAGLAFTRHATSKLADERGLECISTMGFRGEALAAISAVSRIELKTRRKADSEGCFVHLEAGEIQDMGLCGCPAGTEIVVRDLFYNTPARHKFMKSDRAEAAACEQTALRCALGHPEISLRFIKDGRESFFSPGDTKAESCVYSLLGRDIASSFIPCKSEDGEGMSLTGFISSPSAARGNRSCQYFYCNGRYIRSPLMQTALEQAYKNSMLTGRFPACVLYLSLRHGSVDVNVHPAKTEVKFSQEKKVFDFIYQAVLLALENERIAADAVFARGSAASAAERKSPPAKLEKVPAYSSDVSFKARPKEDFYRSLSAGDYRKMTAAADERRAAPAVSMPPEKNTGVFEQRSSFPVQKSCDKPDVSADTLPSQADFSPVARAKSAQIPYQSSMELFDGAAPRLKMEKIRNSDDFSTVSPEESVENSVQNVENDLLPFRLIGETLKTYILVEQDDSLILIDKHAAHERMLFDALREQKRQIMSQTLLSPAALSLSAEDCRILEDNLPLLEKLGFEIEPFGESGFVVRAVPADMDSAEAAAAVEEICEKLRRGMDIDPAHARDEILHTVACKAAIKAGWDTDSRELDVLVRQVLSGKIKYCPHGRPIAVRMSRRELDKQFKRIV